MAVRRLGAMAIALLVATASARAQAQTRLYGTARAELAYTDNLFSARRVPAAGQAGRVATWFVTLAPGLGIYHDARRARYLASYSHGFTFYPSYTSDVSHSDYGLLTGIFLLSPRDEMTIELAASRLSAIQLVNQPGVIGQPQLNGQLTVLTGEVRETLRHDYSERWRGRQTNAFNAVAPRAGAYAQPLRFSLMTGAGAEYHLEQDAWALDLEATYFHALPTDTQFTHVPATQYLTVGPVAQWRHDLNRYWTTALRGGAQAALWISTAEPVGYYPLWGVGLGWHREQASLSLDYGGQVAPNLFSNQVYFRQTASLTGRVPLLLEGEISAYAMLLGSSNRLVNGSAGSRGTLYAWGTQAGIGWFPLTLPHVTLGYLHTEQIDATGYPGFFRNQVMLSVEARYPTFEQGPIPTEAPERVDETDRPAGSPGLTPAASRPELPRDPIREPTEQDTDALGAPDPSAPAAQE